MIMIAIGPSSWTLEEDFNRYDAEYQILLRQVRAIYSDSAADYIANNHKTIWFNRRFGKYHIHFVNAKDELAFNLKYSKNA